MQHSAYNPVGVFDDQVSNAFLEASIRSLKACYERAYKWCKKYKSQVAHDVRAIVRRAEFEHEWFDVVQRYPEMSAEFHQNAAKNCYHILIRCGRVILTQSFIDQRLKLVRRAMFRDTYARRNEGFLFEEMAPAPPPDGAPLYAILMHDSNPRQDQLAIAELIFPDAEGAIVGRISLADRFPHLFGDADVAAVRDTTEHVHEKDLDIGLRDDVKEKRKSV